MKFKTRFKHQYRIWRYGIWNVRKIFKTMKEHPVENVQEKKIPALSVFELKEKLDTNSIQVIDVRGGKDFKDFHIPGSIHLEFNTVMNNVDKIPTDKALAVVCYGGGASEFITELLIQEGFSPVYNITGGIIRYALDIDQDMLELI
ncbi:MAG: rhodanese-like domain-containing protein [Candidatus Heimdallarchaeota archaeon]|nr:rhodanese-like domain-containing protein [Candidatus Heimdallarchaeota archaeon]